MFSTRAVLIAVLVAFLTGLLASLAVRPPAGAARTPVAVNGEIDARIKWRVPMYVSKSLPGAGETPTWLAESIARASNGAVQLQLFDPGEIVPTFAITDAVRDGKVAAGITWLGYDQGKIPSAALFGATPFGMTPWAYMGWWYFGGGETLANEVYGAHNVKPIFCAISGPETAGWYHKPIDSLADIKGLKIRFAGIGGRVLERLGASVTMLPAGEIFQALETGVIDATEFSQPITDQALGFARIAKFNYYPGWHQPFSAAHLIVNLDVWNALSAADQQLIETSCTAGVTRNLGLSESLQGPIIAGFETIGVSARVLPDSILRELQRVTDEVLNEEAAKDAAFNAVLASQRRYKEAYDHWKRLAYLPKEF